MGRRKKTESKNSHHTWEGGKKDDSPCTFIQTDGHRNYMTESAQWADSVKIAHRVAWGLENFCTFRQSLGAALTCSRVS